MALFQLLPIRSDEDTARALLWLTGVQAPPSSPCLGNERSRPLSVHRAARANTPDCDILVLGEPTLRFAEHLIDVSKTPCRFVVVARQDAVHAMESRCDRGISLAKRGAKVFYTPDGHCLTFTSPFQCIFYEGRSHDQKTFQQQVCKLHSYLSPTGKLLILPPRLDGAWKAKMVMALAWTGGAFEKPREMLREMLRDSLSSESGIEARSKMLMCDFFFSFLE